MEREGKREMKSQIRLKIRERERERGERERGGCMNSVPWTLIQEFFARYLLMSLRCIFIVTNNNN